jgi:hypothetical protein
VQLEAAGLQGPEPDAAALQLGKAIGMAALLRGTSYHASRWLGTHFSLMNTSCCKTTAAMRCTCMPL